MQPVPVVVWREGQDAGDDADRVICLLREEIGSVAAIMKDDEDADEETRCRKSKGDGDPHRDPQPKIHGGGSQHIQEQRTGQLPDAFFQTRVVITFNDLCPGKFSGFLCTLKTWVHQGKFFRKGTIYLDQIYLKNS